MVNTVAIIGLGLIGGSVAKAIRRHELADTIYAYDHDEPSLAMAMQEGIIDQYFQHIDKDLQSAELIIIATPLHVMGSVFQQIAPYLTTSSIVTDVAGVKVGIEAQAKQHLGDVFHRYVPGHPVAGREQHGYGASDPHLFNKHRVLLTPASEVDKTAINVVRTLWEAMGAEVVLMSSQHHDELLASTSHFPHLLAYGLMAQLSQCELGNEIFSYAAGGLRDFTRIAASDPNLWKDICVSNKTELLPVLDRYVTLLEDIRSVLKNDDEGQLLAILQRGKAAKDHFNEVLQKRLQS